jgi:hypothetical protein
MEEEKGLEMYNNKENKLTIVNQLDEVNKIVDAIAKSTLGVPFRSKIDDPDSVNKSDIVANIIMGQELGLAPLNAIALGKRLNIDTYLCVLKGKTLGIDWITSMDKIWLVKTSQGSSIAVHTDIICKVMLDNGLKWEIIENFVPVYGYYHEGRLMNDDECLENGNLKSKFVIIYPTTTVNDIKTIKESNKVPITKKEITKRTTIKFTRVDKDMVKIDSMTLQDAIDEGSYNGYHSTLKDENGKPLYMEGKAAWNNYAQVRIEGRLLARNGRKLIADKLGTIYDINEISNEPKIIDVNHEEVK